MDIFKFVPYASKWDSGKIINGLKTKMWVERYQKEGEFTFTAAADSGIREQLPIGSFVSHVDTTEVMIVENHELSTKNDSSSDIKVTGRGFESIFETKVVGSNKTFPVSGQVTIDYALPLNYPWIQAITLINNHIQSASLLDPNNALANIQALAQVYHLSPVVPRTVKRGSVYDRLMEILKIEDLGIKIIRPGVWSPLNGGSVDLAIVIHVGTDKSSSVIFSYDTGEIISADYLWSNKKTRNAALVTGTWVETVVTTGPTGYNRRMMFIDASDIDKQYTAVPTGTNYTDVLAALQQRGLDVLASQKDTVLTKAEVSRQATNAIYRKDFDVGDLITVSGDYNVFTTMRVSEYVESEDDTGKSSYPTLTVL